MFASFLLPYIDRGQGPIYHWIMLMQAARFERGELALVADEPYFRPPLPWGNDFEGFGFRFRCPSVEEWNGIARCALPPTVFEELERRSRSMLDAFRILLTEEYLPLVTALEHHFALMKPRPEAVVTWCRVPSLIRAAESLGLPVIHNEIGALRPPLYRSTVYFDFQGVNGFTSAAEQMQRFYEESSTWRDFTPLTLEQLRDLLIVKHSARAVATSSPQFRAGAALQVEDDSNLIAFGRGMTNFELIFSARKGLRPDQLLIREHPHGYAHYSEKLGVRDDSHDAVVFLRRCEQLFTTNSSIAFECLLQEKPVTVFGDSPASTLSVERLAVMTPQERLRRLNWLFVGYLVPAHLLFDTTYYRWRLTNPPLREIFDLHLEEFRRLPPDGIEV